MWLTLLEIWAQPALVTLMPTWFGSYHVNSSRRNTMASEAASPAHRDWTMAEKMWLNIQIFMLKLEIGPIEPGLGTSQVIVITDLMPMAALLPLMVLQQVCVGLQVKPVCIEGGRWVWPIGGECHWPGLHHATVSLLRQSSAVFLSHPDCLAKHPKSPINVSGSLNWSYCYWHIYKYIVNWGSRATEYTAVNDHLVIITSCLHHLMECGKYISIVSACSQCIWDDGESLLPALDNVDLHSMHHRWLVSRPSSLWCSPTRTY